MMAYKQQFGTVGVQLCVIIAVVMAFAHYGYSPRRLAVSVTRNTRLGRPPHPAGYGSDSVGSASSRQVPVPFPGSVFTYTMPRSIGDGRAQCFSAWFSQLPQSILAVAAAACTVWAAAAHITAHMRCQHAPAHVWYGTPPIEACTSWPLAALAGAGPPPDQPTVLLADPLAPCGLAALRDVRCAAVGLAGGGAELQAALVTHQPAVLVVRSTKVTAAMMDACPSLQLILRAGAGVDNVDVAHAAQRGIHVCNCPGMNATAVAELTIGLMIALDRRIVENVTDSRQRRWDKAKYSAALGLAGRTLGVIGSGNIAQAVIRIALGMQMNVICWGRSLTAESAAKLGVGFRHSPLAVAADAHVVTLHVAANAETVGLAGWDFFRAMRPGALFLNTTRGSVVDEAALLWALREKGIRAGLDVFQGEPVGGAGELRSALAEHPNVYVTHHIGAATEQAQDATALEAVRVIKAFVEDGVVLNAVVQ